MKKTTKYIYFCDFETTSGESEYCKRPCCNDKKCSKCNGDGFEHYRTKVLYWYLVRKPNDFVYIHNNDEWEQWKDSVKEYYMGYDLFSFLSTLRKLNHNSLIYFHNLTYDGSYIIWFLQNEYMMKTNNRIPWIDNQVLKDGDFRKKTYFRTLHDSSKIFQIEINLKSSKGYFKHLFQCSSKLLSSSVEGLSQITKDFKADKFLGNKELIKKFYTISDINELDEKEQALYKAYCKNDCFIIVYNYMSLEQNFDEHINNRPEFLFERHRKINIQSFLTISAINERITKNYLYNTQKTSTKIDLESYVLGRKFYRGGYTNFSYQVDDGGETIKCKDGIGIDINSSYPFQMTCDLPYGKPIDYDVKPCKKPQDYYWFFEVMFDYACLKPGFNIPILYVNSKENIDTYVGSSGPATIHLTEIEFNELLHWYDFRNLRINRRYYCKKKPVLRDIYKTLYDMRLEYKANNNIGGSLMTKILMNSGYGKFAQNPFRDITLICDNETHRDEILSNETLTINKKIYVPTSPLKLDGGWSYGNKNLIVLRCKQQITDENRKVRANNIWMAAAIASGARVALFSAMRALGVKDVVYVDTDSIYLKERPENIEKKIFVDNKALGAWKVEKENITEIKVIGKKKYFIKTKSGNVDIKYCGAKISEEHVKKLLCEDFYRSQIAKGNLKSINVPGGKLLVWKNIQLRTIRRH